jgi:hypothetical protein
MPRTSALPVCRVADRPIPALGGRVTVGTATAQESDEEKGTDIHSFGGFRS